ncbi:unnamed protein product [Rotaria magnacalcarata]
MNARLIFTLIKQKNILRDANTTADDVIANNHSTKLFILLPCQVVSVICSLFVGINIIKRPAKFIKPIRNHFIIPLLITSFVQVTTELSMVENYLHIGVVLPSTNSYCLFFNWYAFSLNGINLFVMCWTSIERHIIIFSQSVFQIRWKRIAFHYVPLSIAILYTPTWYVAVIFIYNCVNDWNYYELLCTAPCFYENRILGIVDWLTNTIIPTVLIAVANIFLLIRVIYRSTGIRHNAERAKRNKKMTIQLLAISSLFLVFRLPIAVTGLMQQLFDVTFIIDIQFNIFSYLIYFIQLLLPFVCLISLPELKKTIGKTIRRWIRRNAISDVRTLHVASIMPAMNQ